MQNSTFFAVLTNSMDWIVKRKKHRKRLISMLLFILRECMWVRSNERWGNGEGAQPTGHVCMLRINSETQRRVKIKPVGLIRMTTALCCSAHTHTNQFRSHNVFWTVDCAAGIISVGIHRECTCASMGCSLPARCFSWIHQIFCAQIPTTRPPIPSTKRTNCIPFGAVFTHI